MAYPKSAADSVASFIESFRSHELAKLDCISEIPKLLDVLTNLPYRGWPSRTGRCIKSGSTSYSGIVVTR